MKKNGYLHITHKHTHTNSESFVTEYTRLLYGHELFKCKNNKGRCRDP